jgi:DNA polymerase-3 subunit gamma/tau
VVRDLLVLSVDPSRVNDPEIAAEGERDRLTSLAGQFSREDLLRAFDVLTQADAEIRGAAQPRYHLEMALLRWMYLRKLVAIEDLIAGTTASPSRPSPSPAPSRAAALAPAQGGAAAPVPKAGPVSRPAEAAGEARPKSSSALANAPLKDALLAEIRKSKVVFYNTVVAQARTIEVTADRIVFTFGATQRAMRGMVEQQRGWLESIAQGLTGRKMAVVVQTDEAASPASEPSAPTKAGTSAPAPSSGTSADPKAADKKSALKAQALADAGVQALLEVFPAEIRDVEEM